jgi:hypothetical protein
MVVVVLPVMLRDSSPSIQYVRGQQDGWRRTCTVGCIMVCGRLSCGLRLCGGVVWRARLASVPACRDECRPVMGIGIESRVWPLRNQTDSSDYHRHAYFDASPSFGRLI